MRAKESPRLWKSVRQNSAGIDRLMRLALILLAVSAFVPEVHAFEAGASKVEITPPLGTPLNGYYDRLGRGAVSVHDRLWARCLYASDGETGILLLNADLCIINKELRDRVLELAPDFVPPEHIILTATHTHSAQGAMCQGLLARSISGRFMPEVLEITAQRFVEAMHAAYADRKRATIGYDAATHEGLTENRRVEDGPIDDQVGVIRVEDADGNAIAIIANLAAHPTTVGGDDQYAVSADFPGFYYDEVERLAEPGCIAMFLNGAEGNQRPANPGNAAGWTRTEKFGKELAAIAMETAGDIACGEATLHVGYATPALPPTIANSLMPDRTIVQTLEIDNLLLTFFPGEPCVEIGLELRRQARRRGYANQFSVGLANDHLLYFVPFELYGSPDYESGMNLYGPRIDRWFYSEFGKLMTKGEPPEPSPEHSPAQVESIDGAQLVRLEGNSYTRGYGRGAAFRDAIQRAYHDHVVTPCRSGEWIPDAGLWSWAPPFIDQTPLALPRLAIGARSLLAGLAPEQIDEIAGIADGAQLPFDAVWLAQCAPTYAAHTDKVDLYRSPFCTMIAVTGDKAGADDCVVGRNFDWSTPEIPVIVDNRPTGGRRFVTVGFPWSAGAFTGMNDAGVVLSVERVESLGEPSLDVPPIELLLSDILQRAADASSAVELIQTTAMTRGYHVLVASPSGEDARVLELGATVTVREPVEGVLLGVDSTTDNADEDAAARYDRIAQLVSTERIVSSEEMRAFLQDRAPGRSGQATIRNDQTRYSVVFEPRARVLHIAVLETPQTSAQYTTVLLTIGDSP
jgi:hypothetical protein